MSRVTCFFGDYFGYNRCIRKGNLPWWWIVFIVSRQVNNLWGFDYRRGFIIVAYLDGFLSLGRWPWPTRYALDSVFIA
jgi:hypothetical protein